MKDVNILLNNGVNVQASLDLLGDMEMYDETLSDFLDMVSEKVEKLEKFKAENDMPNYAIEIHALKSDARYLGFLELGDLAYDSELKAKASDVSGVTTNHPVIMQKLQAMINTASSYLGKTPINISGGASAPAETPAPVAQAAQAEPAQAEPSSVAAQPTAQPVAQAVATPQTETPESVASVITPVVNAETPAQPSTPTPVEAQTQVQAPAPETPAPVATPVTEPAQEAAPEEKPATESIQILESTPIVDGVPVTQTPEVAPQVQVQNVVQSGGQFPRFDPMTGQPLNLVPGQIVYNVFTGASMQVPLDGKLDQLDPMTQALYNQQTVSSVTSLAPKEGTILVVDDSNLVANFVKKIFDKKYEVVIANDGAKAIELCSDDNFRAKIKACLLDLNMPNVDGFQVLDDFYKKGYFVKMPIAVISGVEDSETIDKVNNFPIIDILAKPFNERDVERVVEKCLAAYF